MRKVKVKKEHLRKTIKKIQDQYEQIMRMAGKCQENGITPLCNNWHSPNAYMQINSMVNLLNDKMRRITRRYLILTEKLNGWAGDIVRSGGGEWHNIPLDTSCQYTFNANGVSDGNFGEETLFDEDVIIEAIGRIKQMSKNIIKNQRETSAIFARNNECFGIESNSPKVFDNFKRKMEKFAKQIDEELNECISKLNLVTDEQKIKLDATLNKYSSDSLLEYSSDGWYASNISTSSVSSIVEAEEASVDDSIDVSDDYDIPDDVYDSTDEIGDAPEEDVIYDLPNE